MKKLTFWWKQFCFSVGAQINAVLLLMLILFLSFSIYNHSLFNQFNARYQKEIDQYYSILELKNHFLQSGILFEEYMKTGNRTTLAEFNDTYEKARSVIDILYTESTNEESWYLLRGIDQSFESYYSECCNASFLFNGNDYRYYDSFYYSQTIGDVKVTSPNPVEVEIRFIMTDGELPTKTVIDGVAAYLQDENIRPLTDKVTVLAPETVKFNIAFTYYVNLSDQSKAGTIQAEVAQAVADYIEWQTRTIGRDINPSELMKRIVAAGAKRAEITSPVFTTVPDTSVARIGTQTVTYGGVEND